MGCVSHVFGGRNFFRLLSEIYTTIVCPKVLGLVRVFFFSFFVNVAYFRLINLIQLPMGIKFTFHFNKGKIRSSP